MFKYLSAQRLFCKKLYVLKESNFGAVSESFYRKLCESPSKEVRVLVKIVGKDPRSSTCRNIRYLCNKTELEVEKYSTWRIKKALPVSKVPEKEKWRIGFLECLLKLRYEKSYQVEDMQHISAMIQSLCST